MLINRHHQQGRTQVHIAMTCDNSGSEFAIDAAMDTRINGTLKTWNESKGFGFIAPLNGGQDIFVHISDYPKQGGQPKLGEPLSFEVALNSEGKKKAARILRPRSGIATSNKASRLAPVRQRMSWLERVIVAALVLLVAAAGYKFIAPRFNSLSSAPAAQTNTPIVAAPKRFTCDGRTSCPQMTSCEEATYFIRNCPNTEMDGDRDGIPCESQWCTSMLSR